MQIALLLVSGGAQLTECARRHAVDAELGHERSAFGPAHEDRTPVVHERPEPTRHEPVEGHERGFAARQREAPEARTRRGEELDTPAASGCVGDHERPVRSQVERVRPKNASGLGPDLDDLAWLVHLGRDDEDGMGAAVENGERAVGCLTAERQLGEASGDVRGKAADRARAWSESPPHS